MEHTCEEATSEESACSGPRPIRWPGAQRVQKARRQRERSQGRSGQKPEEDYRQPAQCAPAAARTPHEKLSAAIFSIQARFGKCAIGLGYLGIRYI